MHPFDVIFAKQDYGFRILYTNFLRTKVTLGMETIRILAVDDHEMTAMGYKFILEGSSFDDFVVKVETARTFERAKELIDGLTMFDIILLDIQLANNDDPLKNGEELGIYARSVMPDAKIVFMSTFSDNYRINSILASVDPDGYMVKTEIDQRTLPEMVKSVLTDPPYYSKSALQAIRRTMSSSINLDINDKEILYLLSKGIKTKDIIKQVPLSLPAIEQRKRHLKEIFGVSGQNDQALITQAQKKGFI